MEDFDTFWALYPKKVAKADARKAWAQTKDIRPELTNLLTAITAACKTESWMKSGGAFIPYPATWLRGERWDDIHEVTLPNVVNDKSWHETWPGIQVKGAELGIFEFNYSNPQEFRAAVIKAAKEGLKAA